MKLVMLLSALVGFAALSSCGSEPNQVQTTTPPGSYTIGGDK